MNLSDTFYQKAREAFDSYAHLDAPALPENERSALQVRLNRWEMREFGYQPAERMSMGITEEIGELHEAWPGATDSLDAIADICVYAMNLSPHVRIDFWTLASADATPWIASAGRALSGLSIHTGKISHALLKSVQKIRGFADQEKLRRATAEGLYNIALSLHALCALQHAELWSTVLYTAEKVMQRTWKTDPEKGGTAP